MLAFIAALLLAGSSGFAQNRTVTGTVKDETGNPLVGAAVFVEENASIGAISDANGNYSISVPESAVNLVYSFIGMNNVVEPINGRNVINVTLKTSSIVMEAAVVTAMGITKSEKSLSYNVQQMELESVSPTGSFVNSLNGKVAGVTINSSSTGIGGSTRVVMRGTKSLSNNNNALYVIDGIPMANVTAEQPQGLYEGAGQTGDILSSINPDDIESISTRRREPPRSLRSIIRIRRSFRGPT